MQKRLYLISPNTHNAKLFVDSLRQPSIESLAEDIQRNGLHHPIRITRRGSVIIDGERRWRACYLLGWKTIEVIEEPVRSTDILDMILDGAENGRPMTLREQALVYRACFHRLRRSKRKGVSVEPIEARMIAMRRARLTTSAAVADQLVTVMTTGDLQLQERVMRGEVGITAAFERIVRRRRMALDELEPPPPPTNEQLARVRMRERAKQDVREELEFTRRYVEAHQEELASQEAQRKLLALFEPDPAPAPLKFPDNEAINVIAEAFEALAVKESPEVLVGRLAALIETVVAGVREVDEGRARNIVRHVLKPMALRISRTLPRQEFEVPIEA